LRTLVRDEEVQLMAASNGARPEGAVLDRASTVPLWSQLADDLRSRAAAGEFAQRFPTDADLVRTYGVSRHTAREAVRVLRQEGLLERYRGRGSFLTPPKYEQPLGYVSSLFRWLESNGVDQHSKVLALDVRASPEVAAMLGLPDLAPLVHVSRLRLADGEPIARDEGWLPYPDAEGLLTADFSHTALYEELAHRCGITIDATTERIEAIVPNAEQRDALDLHKGVACLCVTRLGWTGDRLVEFRRTLLRADRVILVADAGEPHTLPVAIRTR
jgi:GntR family transcriptional regulator